MRGIRGLPLLAFLTVLALAAHAGDEEPRVPEAWVEAALEAAGENRPELERVLTHFAASDDPRKLVAARFLVANMPGHGYVLTEFRNASEEPVEFDPLAHETYKEARAALEALESEHGELHVARERLVEDVKLVQADYLIRHIDEAFAAWETCPDDLQRGFDAFLNYVLPYRGSQEPLDFWIGPLRERYRKLWAELDGDVGAIRKRLSQDVHRRVRFNERYYLHPTDQGFKEMVVSGQGRCEDITNMMTYASRSMALATAADYTPAWAHRDNNHAWNVALDAEGRGSSRGNAHAAKVYRKTFALQRDNLAFLLQDGEEAPNRWMSSKTYVDVTDQYRATTDVTVEVDTAIAGSERFAYVCVFNGGRWVAIHWGRIEDGRVTFDRMGRNIAYLTAVWKDGELKAVAPPLLLHAGGTVQLLPGTGGPTDAVLTAVRPKQRSVDTNVETPVSYLKAGTTYRLQRWANGAWTTVREFEAGEEVLRLEGLPSDALYWMVVKESRRLERIFTLTEGRQRFW